jgi:hypothetical protein
LAKSKTSTFVTELPLIVDSFQEKQLLSRFQAARQLYNACLNEAMARMNLVRNCEAYRLAKQTALSQTHLTGERIKKKLSERVHFDQMGFAMHRDLFSAYLSRFVNEEGVLLLHLAVQQWERSEPILHEAWKDFQINREQLGESKSRQSHSPLERFSAELGNVDQIAIFRAKS